MKEAGGIIISIIIKTTGLLPIFKWPLMFISAGLGLALAFVPYEDRPLETWLTSFLRSIYAPTIYTYKKNNDDWLDLTSVKTQGDEENAIVTKNESLFTKKEDDEKTYLSSSYLTKNTKDRELSEPKIVVKDDNQSKVTTSANQILEKSVKENPKVEENTEIVETPEERWKEKTTDLDLKKEKLEATGRAVFGSIPMPDRPDIPNVIVGMATDNEGKIVDGVIVEIQDGHGNPTRVIKTNALGQFKISTPLANGRYLVIAEKDGYIFDRVNIDLSGEIVEPVRIIAHK